MIPEEAVEAGALKLKRIYPLRAVEVSRKGIEAAMPHLLVLSWNAGFSAVSGNPIPFDVLNQWQEVEAAAKAIYADSGAQDRWELLDYQLNWTFREDAKLLLEAAAPHLPVLKEAFEAGAYAANINPDSDSRSLNPYREAALANHHAKRTPDSSQQTE